MSGPGNGTQRLGDGRAGASDPAGRRNDSLDPQRHMLSGLRYRPNCRGEGDKRTKELGGVLRLLHSHYEVNGPAAPARNVAGESDASARIMTAIEPKLPVGWEQG